MDNKTIGVIALLVILSGGVTYEVMTNDTASISQTNYSKVCTPIYEMDDIPIYKMVYNTTSKVDNQIVIGYNKSERLVGCKLTGEILINSTLVKKERYFCGLDNKGVVCDESKGKSGGGADGNGDGICTAGETCVYP